MMLERITVDPEVCGGKPCLRSAEVPAQVVVERLAAGATWEGILQEHPGLERDDIEAALRYAAMLLESPVPGKGVPISVQEAGRRGGRRRREQLGAAGYSALGKKGGSRVRELIAMGRQMEEQRPGG